MKKRIFIHFFILLLSLFSFSVYGEGVSGFNPNNSIEWQKIQLKDKITKQIEEALFIILPEKKSILNVKIDLQEVPSFISPQAPTPPEAEKVQKKKIKLTDIKMEETPPEDFIVFSKMGIAAPIFGDEEAPTSQQAQAPGVIDAATSYAKLAEHYDFFKYLKTVVIDVYLEDNLSPEQKESAETLIRSLNFDTGKIVPTLNIKEMKVFPIQKPPMAPEKKKDLLEVLGKFSNVIALVLAVILAGGVAIFLFRHLSKLLKEQVEGLIAALSNRGNGKKEEKAEKVEQTVAGSGAGAKGAGAEGPVEGLSGLQKFEILLKKDISSSILLIKKWINAKTPIASHALIALAHFLQNDDMISLFEHLSVEDRREWKKSLDLELRPEEFHMAAAFISKQIAENLIVPPIVSDSGLADLISGLSLQELTEICLKDTKKGAMLFNIIDSNLISKILSELDETLSLQVMKAGLALSEEHVKRGLPDFKNYILKYKKDPKRSPFAEKMFELIKVAPPERERLLYLSYSQMVEGDALVKVILENYPYDLFDGLPDDLLKISLRNFSANDRAQFLFALDESKKEKYINLWANLGTKARDLLEFDLEKIEKNKALADKALEMKDEMWKRFVKDTRKIIRNDTDYMEKLKPQALDWADNLKTLIGDNTQVLAA